MRPLNSKTEGERRNAERTLRLESVSLWHGANTTPIVTDISLEILKGETLALVGESGAGKTSLALAIQGLWRGRIRGRIDFQGHELTSLDEAGFSRLRGCRLSLLMQDPMTSINPVLTIGWQLREILRVGRGLSRRDARAESLVWLENVGLTPARDIARAYVYQLSGGMAKRAALAMALACQPDMLIADEPFSALDPVTMSDQIELLDRCRAEVGFSMLLITHNLRIARELAQRVVVLKSGVVIETGSIQEVFNSPVQDYTKRLVAAGLNSRLAGATT